jgi:dipeptidyl aminopeptidase/acylaminoacyl peptidase
MTIGDPGENGARFFDTSPLMRVSEIQSPVLVIHGQLDGRVQIEHYKRLTSELQKRRKAYDSMVKEHEGYGLHAEASQIELYEKVEEFLGRYLAASTGEAASALRSAGGPSRRRCRRESRICTHGSAERRG